MILVPIITESKYTMIVCIRSDNMKRVAKSIVVLISIIIMTLCFTTVFAYEPEERDSPVSREFSLNDAAFRESITKSNKENREQFKYTYVVSTEDPLFRDFHCLVISSTKKFDKDKDYNSLLGHFKDIARSRGIDVPRVYLGEPSYFDNFELTITPYNPFASDF